MRAVRRTRQLLVQRVAGFVHAYTLYSHVRPFGCSIMLGSYNEHEGAQLFMIEPSGVSFGYYGCAIGKGRQAAKTEIEKRKLSELSMNDAVVEVAKIIYAVHDDVKDKEFELEMSYIGKATNGHHQSVPRAILDRAEEAARRARQEADEGDG